MNTTRRRITIRAVLVKKAEVLFATAVLASMFAGRATAQSSSVDTPKQDDTHQLLMELRDELRQTRSQLQSAQQQIEQLSGEVKSLRKDIAARSIATQQGPGTNSYISATDAARSAQSENGQTASSMEEQVALLQAQVEEQHQTKVESESKYRVKLSGLVLFNAFSNHGGVNSTDVPGHAVPSLINGSTGFTLRQTELGVRVFGPEVAGAHTSGSVDVDFFGGFPQQAYGASSGLLRLRTASFDLDWANTSVTVGLEAPFMSPLSPTSYATIGEPALAESGNLWTWTPQLVAERRIHISDESMFSISGGVMAPLTEGVPYDNIGAVAGPGERSRRPAFGTALEWQSKVFGQTMKLGIGGYTSHLTYDFARETNAWAFTSYWQLPLGTRLELTGEAYRGKAVGGLGGGIWQSVVYDGDPALPTTAFRPLNAVGGWSQLKVRLTPRWETNLAFGQDNVLARDLRWAPNVRGAYYNPLARNRTAFGNVIFHPRSNLVLSAEYRNLRTYEYVGHPSTAGQINLSAGVSF